MSHRLKGAVVSYVNIGVKLGVTLLYTPILVKALGMDGYGLFSLVGAIAAYLYIFDFGINDSVLRFFVAHEQDQQARWLSRAYVEFLCVIGSADNGGYCISDLEYQFIF
ncbi:MAG: hypothetical protein VW395_04935 [Methylotenera sp.]